MNIQTNITVKYVEYSPHWHGVHKTDPEIVPVCGHREIEFTSPESAPWTEYELMIYWKGGWQWVPLGNCRYVPDDIGAGHMKIQWEM